MHHRGPGLSRPVRGVPEGQYRGLRHLRDGLKSHENFKCKQEFPFELISDKDEAVCQLFDVIKLKKLYGKEYMGVDRSTFLIDRDGVLRQEWRGVKVPGHVDAVLAAAQALNGT